MPTIDFGGGCTPGVHWSTSATVPKLASTKGSKQARSKCDNVNKRCNLSEVTIAGTDCSSSMHPRNKFLIHSHASATVSSCSPFSGCAKSAINTRNSRDNGAKRPRISSSVSSLKLSAFPKKDACTRSNRFHKFCFCLQPPKSLPVVSATCFGRESSIRLKPSDAFIRPTIALQISHIDRAPTSSKVSRTNGLLTSLHWTLSQPGESSGESSRCNSTIC
mmetsp:Transcript_61958/g.122549  ORF Transcript_61958/g.122549 Transcript_61958/m.122549 type:complete len:219 (-) Transcript_61958:320-976(-)